MTETEIDMPSQPIVLRIACLSGLITAGLLATWGAGESAGAADNLILMGTLLIAAAGFSLLWPVLDERLHDRPMAPLIAFIGCDGSGKSSITRDLQSVFAQSGPVATCYLGLGTGDLGERIKRWPLIGRLVERKLVKKANQARTPGEKIPGLATAIVIYVLSLGRLRRFKRMLRLRRAGVTVLTDRYPQIEIAGFYDGPGLSAATPGGRLVAAIARHERQLYKFMAGFRPDVVVRLNVDVATAIARKPDHRLDLLKRKAAATPLLRFTGARIIDLDANLPYRQVLASASGIAWAAIQNGPTVVAGRVHAS